MRNQHNSVNNKEPDRILRPREAAEFLGISLSTLWARLDPKNPRYDRRMDRPIKLHQNPSGKGAVGFRLSGLIEYLEECME